MGITPPGVRLAVATTCAAALFAGALPAAAAPIPAAPAAPAAAAKQKQRATATVTSLGVAYDRTYGPVEKLSVSVTNTGTVRTRYLDLRLASGAMYLDAEGQQMFIGNCLPRALPLAPGASTTCQAERRLTGKEIARGRTRPQNLQVWLFGKDGYKVTGLRTKATRFDVSDIEDPAAPKPKQRATASVVSRGVAWDRTYGAVEKIAVSVKNTGSEPTRYLDLRRENGKAYVDDEGEQMFIGNCTPRALPLRPGASTTCEAYRLLTDAEIGFCRTIPQDLQVWLFGQDGFKVTGLLTASTKFAPSQVTPRS